MIIKILPMMMNTGKLEAFEHGNMENGNDADRAVMQNTCISTKSYEETCTKYSASKPVEFCMGSDTKDVIYTLFNTIYKDFNKHKKHQW